MPNATMLSGIFAVYGVILLLSLVFGIVSYIFQSLGLYRMAKNLNLSNPWMAWVPLLSTYTLGKIGSKYVKQNGRPSAKFGGWLIGLEIAMVVAFIIMLGSIISMIPSLIGMAGAVTLEFDGALVGSFMTMVLSYLTFLAVAIAYSVVYYIALWRLFAIFDNSTATVFLIISILFGVATPFLIFAIRNNRPALTFEERIGFIPQISRDTETIDE